MNLVSFTVENFRSITSAHKIKIERSAVLVGPNNEGKSNILRALITAMRILTEARRMTVPSGFIPASFYSQMYNWKEDFPVHLQKQRPNGESVLILEFELSPSEIEDFRQVVKSNLNGTLPIQIELGPQQYKIRVNKQGPGAKSLTAKSDKIAGFVARRLQFVHIPAVRTAESARRVVDRMVERELQAVEKDPAYVAALEQVAKIQQPILDKLSTSIKSTLVQFLPAVKDVKVQIASERRHRALRRCEIIVDDGTATHLESKGDGVQSLAALGIMRHASDTGASGRNLIVAIEEPESHLHPKAIHEVRDVLRELASTHQIVITTHCPLFVNRANIKTNIIVNNKKAQPAKTIEQIREVLGVRAADNLRHAEVVLLVEGEEDRVALGPLLGTESVKLKRALDDGTVAIDTLGGGSNLSYKVGLIRDALCAVHCFLDDDKSGREAFRRAKLEGLLTEADVNFSTCSGMSEAEIEDMYPSDSYAQMINNKYGVTLESPAFKTSKKWSDRMKEVFRQQGKQWEETTEREVKFRVAALIAENPGSALNQNKRSAFDALVRLLEARLERSGQGG